MHLYCSYGFEKSENHPRIPQSFLELWDLGSLRIKEEYHSLYWSSGIWGVWLSKKNTTVFIAALGFAESDYQRRIPQSLLELWDLGSLIIKEEYHSLYCSSGICGVWLSNKILTIFIAAMGFAESKNCPRIPRSHRGSRSLYIPATLYKRLPWKPSYCHIIQGLYCQSLGSEHQG